jgi:hypothetical protein
MTGMHGSSKLKYNQGACRFFIRNHQYSPSSKETILQMSYNSTSTPEINPERLGKSSIPEW